MMKLQNVWTRAVKLSACGENDSINTAWPGLKRACARGGPGLFPPELIIQVKALACEIPASYNVPISRWTAADLGRYIRQSGIVAKVSNSTIWRWLNEDAIKPWQYRCWIFPRDPQFAVKAGKVLDLYHRVWNHCALKEDEYVISADEKTSIQARSRRHATYPAMSGSPMKVEHEYKRSMSFWCQPNRFVLIPGLDALFTRLPGKDQELGRTVAYQLFSFALILFHD
jgi:hypothetical protein